MSFKTGGLNTTFPMHLERPLPLKAKLPRKAGGDRMWKMIDPVDYPFFIFLFGQGLVADTKLRRPLVLDQGIETLSNDELWHLWMHSRSLTPSLISV